MAARKRATKTSRGGAKKSKSASRATKSKGRRRTAAKKPDIRATIHDFTLRAIERGELRMRELPAFAGDVVKDAAAGLNRAIPSSSGNVLRQVVQGLTDAATATASSARSALSATAERGGEFMRRDASRTVRDLRDLENNFVRALERAGRSLKGAAKEEMDSIVHHAKRAGTRIRPAAQRTAKAIDGRLLELGKETAKAGARASRSALGGALGGASGFLGALGEALARPSTRKRAH